MSTHATAYKSRIEDLESDLEKKSLKVSQLEKSVETFKAATQPSWASGEGARIMELHERLIKTESSELQLKQRVSNLERNGGELEKKVLQYFLKIMIHLL